MLLDHLPAYYPENFQVRASPSGGLEGGARGARFGPDTRVKVEAENWRAEYVLGDYEESLVSGVHFGSLVFKRLLGFLWKWRVLFWFGYFWL